jgi:hypothetical protein
VSGSGRLRLIGDVVSGNQFKSIGCEREPVSSTKAMFSVHSLLCNVESLLCTVDREIRGRGGRVFVGVC